MEGFGPVQFFVQLIRVERLARFYKSPTNYFSVQTVAYTVHGTKVNVSEVHFVPIEFLSWDCLTIGALGWGQIQIANSNRIILDPTQTRKEWMLQFCNIMLDFYPKEIEKIDKRMQHFQNVREHWQQLKE